MQARAIALALLFLAGVLAACAGPGHRGAGSDPARIFHADPRWLGGDAAISVPLSDDRILWLFGDSFVDPEPPYRRSEAMFPRNTVAIQTGADPRHATMAFAWRNEDGAPASFFAEDGKAWFWPGGGIRLRDGTLALFLHRILATNAAPPLGFETRGYAVMLVANPGDAPADWRMRRIDGPALPFDALPGAAVVRDDAHVVALAVRAGDHAGTFVRFGEADLARGDLARAEWWSGERGWQSTASLGSAGPAFVLPGAGPEASLHWNGCVFVHVASRGFGASDIVARTAPRLTGPWSKPRLLARPVESDGRAPFVYAGKAHAALKGTRGGLALSYVASSFDSAALLTSEGQRDLYWPRIIDGRAPACP